MIISNGQTVSWTERNAVFEHFDRFLLCSERGRREFELLKPPKLLEEFGNAQQQARDLDAIEMTAAATNATYPPLLWSFYPNWKWEQGVSYARFV